MDRGKRWMRQWHFSYASLFRDHISSFSRSLEGRNSWLMLALTWKKTARALLLLHDSNSSHGMTFVTLASARACQDEQWAPKDLRTTGCLAFFPLEAINNEATYYSNLGPSFWAAEKIRVRNQSELHRPERCPHTDLISLSHWSFQ